MTKYADELLDKSKIEWPEKINTMQTNWIGRSEGVDVEFDVSEYGLDQTALTTFTTRIDTIFGVTFVVLAPEHPLVDKSDDAGAPFRGRGVCGAGKEADGDRASVDREGEDGRPSPERTPRTGSTENVCRS